MTLSCAVYIRAVNMHIYVYVCMTFVNDSRGGVATIVHLNKAEVTSLLAHVDPRSKESKLEI